MDYAFLFSMLLGVTFCFLPYHHFVLICPMFTKVVDNVVDEGQASYATPINVFVITIQLVSLTTAMGYAVPKTHEKLPEGSMLLQIF